MSKIAFIYPGQGSQKCGMGKDFYVNYEDARQVIDKAAERIDFDLKGISFEENKEIHRTEYTQPALVAVCLAITKVIQEKGINPDVTAGLSLGEYAAIAAAGAIDPSDAVRLVRQRGIYMQQAAGKDQSMAAVLGMAEDQIEAIIAEIEHVFVANYNCPGQTVITGRSDMVARAGEILLEKGAKRVLPLQVSGAFHSPFMKPAAGRLSKLLEEYSFNQLQLPYVTNVTAEEVTDALKIPELLCRQVASPVRFSQSIQNMITAGVDTFIEIGPGRTLSGFIKKIDRSVKVVNVETVEDLNQLC